MTLAKPIRKRDEAYKAWIRDQVSVVSGLHRSNGYVMEANHIRETGHGGMGTKPDDSRTLPFTVEEHREYHDIGKEAFELKYGLDIAVNEDIRAENQFQLSDEDEEGGVVGDIQSMLSELQLIREHCARILCAVDSVQARIEAAASGSEVSKILAAGLTARQNRLELARAFDGFRDIRVMLKQLGIRQTGGQMKPRAATRVCKVCQQEKPIGDFPFNHQLRGLRQHMCKPCKSADQKARNAEKQKANRVDGNVNPPQTSTR